MFYKAPEWILASHLLYPHQLLEPWINKEVKKVRRTQVMTLHAFSVQPLGLLRRL